MHNDTSISPSASAAQKEDNFSPEAKAYERGQLASDVEQFLAQGGKVQAIPKGERADPPRKPENNYGRSSI